ncbi:MAG: Xaa-Pro peptidase family protein [candidate division Zixibacteria bacterium]|nr:Xaa-Pro peptidase family protein [candidate division Zixibacteria bacterium]
MKKMSFLTALILFVCITSIANATDLKIFQERRETLRQKMGTGVGLVFAGEEMEGERFAVNPDFCYLTGLDDEPGAILILAPAETKRKEVLLLKSRDPETELWEGERLPIGEELRRKTGFEQVRRTGELGRWLNRLAENSRTLCLLSRPASYTSPIPKDLSIFRDVQSRMLGIQIKDCTRLITEMRLIKTPAELALMEKAIQITENALEDVITGVKSGLTEEQIQIRFENHCRADGAKYLAFPSIIATGHNSTILHYTKNDAEITNEDLLLMDVGAETEHYAADITRTIPVSGKFSARQKEIYSIVWEAQQAALKKLKSGVTIDELYDTAREVITKAGYKDYFMHGLSHFIGLEVHDVGFYDEPLRPGMVISVEPGIYLPEEDIGVRIEDDVLITKNGYRMLTDGIPTQPDELETFVQKLRTAR